MTSKPTRFRVYIEVGDSSELYLAWDTVNFIDEDCDEEELASLSTTLENAVKNSDKRDVDYLAQEIGRDVLIVVRQHVKL